MLDTIVIERVKDKLEHIKACAKIWEGSKISRVRTIIRTASEIAALIDPQAESSGSADA